MEWGDVQTHQVAEIKQQKTRLSSQDINTGGWVVKAQYLKSKEVAEVNALQLIGGLLRKHIHCSVAYGYFFSNGVSNSHIFASCVNVFFFSSNYLFAEILFMKRHLKSNFFFTLRIVICDTDKNPVVLY